MKKNPLFVAVSNQKGGVGKSTMLVTLASLLNYSMDRNIAIVDCDSTQRSLFNLRERDMEMVEKNKKYMVQLDEQRLRGRRIYPIRRARPEDARLIAGELAETGDYDIIFIDLPGTMDVSGVLQTIFNVDYVLTPIAADNFVMDSSFSFASSVMKFTKERKDIKWALCISSLAAFGGMIPNLRFYSKREMSPLVSVMWVGPSSSGKGNINTIERIVNLYDDAIGAWQQETEINPAKAKKKEYDDCMAQYKASKDKSAPCDCGEEPIVPKKLHLLTSAHTSESQLAYRIYSNSIFTTFFVTEEIASAASNRFQKYGIKNEFWRDSLESGSITIDYKNGDYFKVPEVHLIQIAGGTLSAVQQFIEDQDGGLFARYIYLPLVNDFQYIPLSEMTIRKRDYWAKLQGSINTFAKFTLKSHVEVTFSRECLDLLTEKIAACNAKSTYLESDAMTSFTMRLRNKVMSLCATLTYMHAYDRNELYDSYTADHPQQIACSVQTARLIASWIDYIYYTAAQFIMPLPTGKIAKLKKQDTLTRDILDNLPCFFTTQDLLKVAADKNVSESTIKRRLKDWLSSHLVEKVSHGIYHKVGCVETKLELKAAPTPAPDPTPVPESEPLHHWDY